MVKYQSLQAGRTFATLLVLIAHTNYVANNITPDLQSPPYWLAFGFAGVDFFFVVSGFVISLIGETWKGSAGRFLGRRFLRIVPFYWLFTLIWLALMAAKGPLPDPLFILRSLAIFPTTGELVLFVGWSLEHEFIFYIIAAFMIAIGRFKDLPIALAVMFGIGLVVEVLMPDFLGISTWDYHIFSVYHFQFLLGTLLYRYRERVTAIDWRILMAAGIVMLPIASYISHVAHNSFHVTSFAYGLRGLVRVLWFGVACAALLGGLLALEVQRKSAFDGPLGRLTVAIGDASYALYLLHPIVNGVVGVACTKLAVPESLLWPVVVFAWVSSTVIALGFYRWVEKPYLDFVHGKRRPKQLQFDGPA